MWLRVVLSFSFIGATACSNAGLTNLCFFFFFAIAVVGITHLALASLLKILLNEFAKLWFCVVLSFSLIPATACWANLTDCCF